MSGQTTANGSTSLQALHAHLAGESEWLKSARDALIAVRRAVATGDRQALQAAVQAQAALAESQAELAQQRSALFASAARELGIRSESASLADIAVHLPEPARGELVALRRELLHEVRALRTLATGTLAVISHNRQLVDGLLGAVLGVDAGETRYTAEGQRHGRALNSLMECRT